MIKEFRDQRFFRLFKNIINIGRMKLNMFNNVIVWGTYKSKDFITVLSSAQQIIIDTIIWKNLLLLG